MTMLSKHNNSTSIIILFQYIILSIIEFVVQLISKTFFLISVFGFFSATWVIAQNENWFLVQSSINTPNVNEVNFWLDATDAKSTKVWDPVSSSNKDAVEWRDKTGNHNMSISNNEYSVETNSLNGLNTIKFSNKFYYPSRYGSSNIGKIGYKHTIFLVAKKSKLKGAMFGKLKSITKFGFALGGRNEQAYAFDEAHPETDYFDPSKFVLLTYTHKPTNPQSGFHLFINGVHQNNIFGCDPYSPSYDSPNAIFFGNDDGTDINFAEIIIYNTYFDDTKRSSIENYLMSKWGLNQRQPLDPDNITIEGDKNNKLFWLDVNDNIRFNNNNNNMKIGNLYTKYPPNEYVNGASNAKLKPEGVLYSIKTKMTIWNTSANTNFYSKPFAIFIVARKSRNNSVLFSRKVNNTYSENKWSIGEKAFYLTQYSNYKGRFTKRNLFTSITTNNNLNLVCYIRDSYGKLFLFINGIQQGNPVNDTFNYNSKGPHIIGSRSTDTGEILFVDKDLSLDERLRLEDYFMKKWGINGN